MSPFPELFRQDLALGRCVALALPEPTSPRVEEALAALPDKERGLAARFGARRRVTFAGGRYALRALLDGEAERCGPILWNERGAPSLPAGLRASISHKDDVAVAFDAGRGEGAAGVDLEARAAKSRDVASYVLTATELGRLGGLDDVSRDDEVLLRFSAKEALYKVLDPYLHRFIGFHEVEVEPAADGTCAVKLLLPDAGVPGHIRVCWTSSDRLGVSSAPFFLTTAVSER